MIFTTATTLFWVNFGPKSFVPLESTNLNEEVLKSALIEPRDKIILISWWLTCLFFIYFVQKFAVKRVIHRNLNYLALLTQATFLLLAIISFTWDKDSTKTWIGVGIKGIIVGIILVLIIFINWFVGIHISRYLVVLFLTTMLAFLIPAFIQTPGSIRDFGHFTFTGDEISAAAAGHFPYFDYFPQYSSLLGIPLALFVKVFPTNPVNLTVLWILFLQLVCFGLIYLTAINLGGKKLILPASILTLIPSLIPGDTPPKALGNWLLSATTYFANFPMRIVLPTICIYYVIKLSKGKDSKYITNNKIMFKVGLLSGLAALNNSDFGMPFVLILLIYFLILVKNKVMSIYSLGVFIVGITSIILTYLIIARLFNKSLLLSEYFVFAKTFGVDGFGNTEMDAFGIHISLVTLFSSAVVIGFWYLTQGIKKNSKYNYRQGTALFLVGGWSLFALTYFSGRSLTPTAIGGYAFLSSFVSVVYLPIIKNLFYSFKFYKSQYFIKSVGLTSAALLIIGSTSTLIKLKSPDIYVAKIRSASVEDNTPIYLQSRIIKNLAQSKIIDSRYQLNQVGFILPWGNLTELVSGVDSLMVFSSDSYLEMSNKFVNMQCREDVYVNKELIWISYIAYNSMKSNIICRETLNLELAEKKNIEGLILFEVKKN